MQDPNEDTDWNAALRQKGIIPEKELDVTEDDLVNMLEATIQQKSTGKELSEMNLDELNEKEDDIDDEEERIFEQYRRQRMAELQEQNQKSKFGDVVQISKSDWVTEVNKAGDGIYVVIHVYKESIPLCKLLNDHLSKLSRKFPQVKYLKGISSVCIPNYPDKNLPTLFVYYEGDMKKQFIGPVVFGGMKLSCDTLEWMLHEVGLPTTLEENPRIKIHDVMDSSIRTAQEEDGNDWSDSD